MTWCFLLMKRGCLGHPQALTVEPLGYFLECPGDIPILRLCPFFILWHHSSLPTLENFLHPKLNTILISNVSAIKIINPLEFRDRKSTRLNSSHPSISYAVFCLKKKKKYNNRLTCEKRSYINTLAQYN